MKFQTTFTTIGVLLAFACSTCYAQPAGAAFPGKRSGANRGWKASGGIASANSNGKALCPRRRKDATAVPWWRSLHD